MILIAGTLPIPDFPLTIGQVGKEEDHLIIEGKRFPCTQGTGALISAALAVTDQLGKAPPLALLAGDIGTGKGSRQIYNYLAKNLINIECGVLVMHYILPDMALMKSVCDSVHKCSPKPVMIADAAAMYAAKAAGRASEFDIFTPDASELSFLADADAIHPAYIAEHLFAADPAQTPQLIEQAYTQKSASRLLLVKGKTDYIALEGQILETIDQPNIPAMEAVGGTGDSITGIVAALIEGGFEHKEAATLAARINRAAGQAAKTTPATTISHIIETIPMMLAQSLKTITKEFE